jgi:hypothetical protein
MGDKIWYDDATNDPRREFIRREMVNGAQGFIAEDLDLVLRVYGERFGTDYLGKFRLVELKSYTGTFNASQQKTLGLMDKMLKESPESFRYQGFYIVYSETIDWKIRKDIEDFDSFEEYEIYEKARIDEQITVNGWDLTKEQFLKWMKWELEIPSVSPFNQIPFKTWNWHNGPFLEGSNLES